MAITFDKWTISTDGTRINDVVSSTPPLATDNYEFATIGELKTLTLEFTSSADIRNKDVYYNPALYGSSSTTFFPREKPSNGFFFHVPSATTGVTNYSDMLLFTEDSDNTLTNKNFNAQIGIAADGLSFNIKLDFYITFDLRGFITGDLITNLERFILDAFVDTGDNTVFDEDKYIVNYIVIDDSGTLDISEDRIKFTSRFYETGLRGASQEIADMGVVLKRSGEVVDCFSKFEDTDVIVCEGYEGITDIVVRLLKVDEELSDQDFINNYQIFEPVTTVVKTSKLLLQDGFLLLQDGSNLLLQDDAGIIFTVATTDVESDGVYRVQAIFYDKDNDIVNSFISDEINAECIPDAAEFTVTPQFTDSKTTHTDEILQVAPLETIKSTIIIDTSTFDSDIQAKIGGTDGWKDLFRGGQVSIYQKDTTSGVEIETIMEQGNYALILGDTVDKYEVLETSDNLSIVVTEPAANQLQIDTTFVVRADESNKNLKTELDGLRASEPTSTQDWRNRNLFIDYQFGFDYNNAVIPYSDLVSYQQKIEVSDYDATAITSFDVTDNAADPMTLPCTDEDINCQITTLDTNALSIDAMIIQEPYNLNSLNVKNSYVSTLPQQDTELIKSVDSTTSSQTGNFTVDGTKLISGSEYEFLVQLKN